MSAPRSSQDSVSGTRVVRLGGMIELDGRVSWAPAETRGRQHLNCYLVRTPGAAVLIDTGVRAHEAEVLDRLDELLVPGQPFAIVLTRTEMDCCLNIPAIEARFPVRAVYYTGGITVPRSAADVHRLTVPEGSSTVVEPVPGIELEIIVPRLRLLPTLWPYDPVSGVLFSSDSFAHGRAAATDDKEPDAVRAQLATKFSWLAHADTKPIERDVEAIFAERQVRGIAPTHGRVFTGERAVAAQCGMLLDAIRGIGG